MSLWLRLSLERSNGDPVEHTGDVGERERFFEQNFQRYIHPTPLRGSSATSDEAQFVLRIPFRGEAAISRLPEDRFGCGSLSDATELC